MLQISIHAPLARCDRGAFIFLPFLKIFQSTHLLRGATGSEVYVQWFNDISIHAPLARCDGGPVEFAWGKNISIHAPLARCDKQSRQTTTAPGNFNPRTSCEVRLISQLYQVFI